jgi:putative colanic acid biosynthesis UDP-glucose lipid carrier transferase
MRIGYHKIGIGAGAIVLLQRLTLPAASLATLYACTYVFGIPMTDEYAKQYLALGLIAALLAYILSRPQPSELSGTIVSGWTVAEKLTMAWFGVVATLLLLGYMAKVSSIYSRRVLMAWFILTPAFSIAMWTLLRSWLRYIFLKTGTASTVVVAGVNNVSRLLANNMQQHQEYGLQFRGFFEDRSAGRLGDSHEGALLGKLRDLPDYVRKNHIDTIFIAIPISNVERTQTLLDDLKDTTASIYFVPDIFVVDLIQSRSDEVSGIHVLALCETPFYGWRAVLPPPSRQPHQKRYFSGSDATAWVARK